MADAKLISLGFPFRLSSIASFANFTLNGAADQAEVIFQAPEAATLTQLGFRYGARTGTPPTYRISLQGVDGSGNPDGTVKGGASPASGTFTPPADTTWNSTYRRVALANPYACSRGELLAYVIAYSSGTVDGSNNSSFTSNTGVNVTQFPCAIQNDAGVRTRQTAPPVFSFESASRVYGLPALAAVSQGVTAASEAALKFSLPSTWTGTYAVAGVRFGAALAAAQTLTVTLYDGGNAGDLSVLQQVALDQDVQGVTAAVGFLDAVYFDESSLSTLTAGNAYRLGLTSTGGTNTLRGLQVDAAGDWDAWQGGQQFALSTRAGGNWADDTTKRPFVELLLADLTGGSGGGAGGVGGARIFTGF